MTVFKYLHRASKLESPEPLMHIATKTFSKEVGDQMMTLGERIREESKLERKLERKLEGKLEGQTETRLEIAKLMLAEKQPLDFIMRLTNLTLEQIKALGNQDR